MQTYQEKAYATAAYGMNIEYPFMSLCEESGEVMGKLGKFVRKQNVFMNDAVRSACLPMEVHERTLRDKVIKELGDLQWQIAACCTELGITLEELQADNLAKLAGRVARGTIEGAGDNR